VRGRGAAPAWLFLGALALLAPPRAAAQRAACGAIADVVVAPPEARLSTGSRATFQATAFDASGAACPEATFSWSSSNVNVVRVDAQGVATGVAPGVALVTVTAGSGSQRRSAQASVTVTAGGGRIASVQLTPRQAQVRVGATLNLTAVALDSAGNAVRTARFVWVSSDLTVARVGADGVVTGVAPGRVTIYTGVAGRPGYVGAQIEVVAGAGSGSQRR
jgi:uncharacterized protein YjdB